MAICLNKEEAWNRLTAGQPAALEAAVQGRNVLITGGGKAYAVKRILVLPGVVDFMASGRTGEHIRLPDPLHGQIRQPHAAHRNTM